jgi:hypothetical protein
MQTQTMEYNALKPGIDVFKELYKNNVGITKIINKLSQSNDDFVFDKLQNIVFRDNYMTNLKANALLCLTMSNVIIKAAKSLKIEALFKVTNQLIEICKKIIMLDDANEQYLLGNRDIFPINPPAVIYKNFENVYLYLKFELDRLVAMEFQDVPIVFQPLFDDLYIFNVLIQDLDFTTESVFIEFVKPQNHRQD